MTTNRKIKFTISAVSSAIVLAYFIHLSLFAWSVNTGHLQGDQWVWVREVLIPYRQGDMSLYEAITYEYKTLSHTHTLTLATFIANERLFGLNLKLDTIIGLIGLAGLSLVIFRALKRQTTTLPTSKNTSQKINFSQEIWFWGILILGASAFYQTGVYSAFTWTLVAFEHIYVFFGILYLYFASKWIPAGQWKPVLAVTALLLLFGDAVGTVAVFAALATSLLILIFERIAVKSTMIIWFGTALLATVFGTLIKGKRPHQNRSPSEALEYITHNITQTIEFGLAGLGRGTLPFTRHYKFGDFSLIDLTPWVGAIILIMAISLVLWVMKTKRISINTFALMLMALTLISIIGVIRSRLSLGNENYIYGHRYYRIMVPFLIGTTMIAYDFWRQRNSKYVKIILTSGLVAFLGLHQLNTIALSKFTHKNVKPSIHSHFKKIDGLLIEYSESDLENRTYENEQQRCKNAYCESAVQYLDEYDLVIFGKSP